MPPTIPLPALPIDPFPSEQRVWLFDRKQSTITTFILTGAVAANFDDDGFRAYVAASNGNVYVLLIRCSPQSHDHWRREHRRDPLASGPFVYMANSAGLQAIATCNNVIAIHYSANELQHHTVRAVREEFEYILWRWIPRGLDFETANTPALTPPDHHHSRELPRQHQLQQ